MQDRARAGRGVAAVTNLQLSERDRQMLRLLVAGDCYAKVAGKLGISRYAVQRAAYHIRQRNGLRTREQVGALAVRAGIA